MATFRPGQVIRFTYRHFWPPDANTREEHKEILVLHTRWQNKVHGIDMKVLTPAQLEILKAVMDPRNNRGSQLTGEAGLDKGRGDDFAALQQRDRGNPNLDQLKGALKSLENKFHLMSAASAARGLPISMDVMTRYNKEKQELKQRIENFTVQDAAPDDPQKIAQKPLPPMAKEILSRMKPARMVNSPRIFYNLFVKPFLGSTDAYRTFFPGRMLAIQVDPRWNWTAGAPQAMAPEGGIPEKQKQMIAPPKMAGAPRPETEFEKSRRGSFVGSTAPTPPSLPGVRPTPPGAAESGVMGRSAGVNKHGITKPIGPTIIKPPRNK